MGLSWLLYRLRYAVMTRIGWLRIRLPLSAWADLPLSGYLADADLSQPGPYFAYRKTAAPPFFFTPDQRKPFADYFSQCPPSDSGAVEEARGLQLGKFRYFSHEIHERGLPPSWHENPITGQQAPTNLHWTQVNDFEFGDIKLIWEINRFGWTYTLVRAYWRTGDESFPALFWQLLEDWRQHNPPQHGVNWKCGQEISFRVMAWCFGLYGFLDSSHTTPARVAMLAQMIAVSGQRIALNIGYALSQNNNHGISEGMGLWTIGLLFPEFRAAAGWAQTGQQILEQSGQDLIYPDGAFSQHAVYYQRLMLADYLWALRLGEINRRSFTDLLRTRLEQACLLLYQMQQETSGQVPDYGSNDGAMVLPLNDCDYQNFKPIIQAVHYLLTGKKSYPAGPWDEDLLWLFGAAPVEAEISMPERQDFCAPEGGYHLLRTPRSFVMTRCAKYRHRPGHADMLHTDLWWKEQNIALDPGTYSYNAPPPWNNSLSDTCYHNTVTVDGMAQMDRVSRFLWLPWVTGTCRVQQTTSNGYFTYWEGAHDGYMRLALPVTCRRGILRMGEATWLILDTLTGRASQAYKLHWLLQNFPYTLGASDDQLVLHTDVGDYFIQWGALDGPTRASLVCADPESPRGWQAPYYAAKSPALSLHISREAETACFWTLFSPGQARTEFNRSNAVIDSGSHQIRIAFNRDIEERTLIRDVSVSGGMTDHLAFTP